MTLFHPPSWLEGARYDFGANPVSACLARAFAEQRGRREAASVLASAIIVTRPGRNRDRLESELADLRALILAVDCEIEMATGLEVLP